MLDKLLDVLQSVKSHVEIDGPNSEMILKHKDYSLEDLRARHHVPHIPLTTLQGFVDYLNSNHDGFDTEQDEDSPVLVHVVASTRVAAYLKFDGHVRETIAITDCTNISGYSTFPNNAWMDHETFILKVRSLFENTDNRQEFLEAIKSVKVEAGADLKDDGVSQQVTVKNAMARLDVKQMPKQVVLKPFRTFHEIEQPEVEYVFRIRVKGENMVECLLIEADGNAWQSATMERAKNYLEKELNGITVIA